MLPRSFCYIRQGCRPGKIKHCIRWHLVLLPEPPGGEVLEREKGQPASACSFFPMDRFFFQGSLKALTHLFCSRHFLAWDEYVISFSWRYISVRAWWHGSPQRSFQKGPSLNLVMCSQLQQPHEVFPGSLERRGQGLAPPVPAILCRLLKVFVPDTSPPSAVFVCLWTAATKLSV